MMTEEERIQHERNKALAWKRKNLPHVRERDRLLARARHEQTPWKRILRGARIRAEATGIPWDLDEEWAATRWTGCCEITGLPFKTNFGRGCGPGPYSCSLDRLKPELGYVKGNVKFVIFGLNAAKSSGKYEDAYVIAKAFVEAVDRSRIHPSVADETALTMLLHLR